MSKRNALAIVVMLAAAATLTGCFAAAVPAASPSPGPTDSGTPTPTSDVPVAASVAISTEAIAVLDAAGAPIVSFDYFQPTADVVAGLSEHLGAPVNSPNPGSIETPPGVDHVWGDLRLFDTDLPGAAPESPNHFVFVEGTSAGTVPIATAAGVGSATGVRVGDPVTSLTVGARLASTSTDPATGITTEAYFLDMVPVNPGAAAPDDPHLAVMVVTHSDTGLIERLVAPSSNFGV
jgi:hypothetical protein